MRAGAVAVAMRTDTAQASESSARPGVVSIPVSDDAVAAARPPSWRELAAAWVGFVMVVLATAAVVAVVAPDWLRSPTRGLPHTAVMIADIATVNLLIALVPLVGGWLAAAYRRRGRRRMALAFALASGLVMVRSLLTVGAVGGADLPWLVGATRWWLLELVAYATASYTGLWLIRHPGTLYRPESHRALRRALAVMVATLVAGAFVEVLST